MSSTIPLAAFAAAALAAHEANTASERDNCKVGRKLRTALLGGGQAQEAHHVGRPVHVKRLRQSGRVCGSEQHVGDRLTSC